MRVSATTLESFRLLLDEDWMTEERFLQGITGPREETRPMALGTAFGRILADPLAHLVRGGYFCNGFEFEAAVMDPAIALFDRRGVFEAKAVKQYGPHTVVAVADQLIGARLIENKTTTSSFSFEKYEASVQWRFMADIFLPASVTYHVFCLDDSPTNEIGLSGIESFTLYPYAGMQAECESLLGAFADYVTSRGLTHCFEREAGLEAA